MDDKCEYITDLNQIMAQCYYQVLAGEKREDNLFEPKGFGSAILYCYHDHIFLVTAEHVVSTANFSFKLDRDKTYIGAIPTNKLANSEEGQPCAECVYFNLDSEDFTKYFTWDNKKQNIHFERLDFYYTQIDQNPQFAGKIFVTHGQVDEDGTTRYGGLKKIILQEKHIATIEESHQYAIFGIVQPGTDKVKLCGKSITHYNMTFLKEEKGNWIFIIDKFDEHIQNEDWAGLSGAAVFDQLDGRVVGIAINYDSENLQLEVIPIKRINIALDAYLQTLRIQTGSNI